MNRDVKDAVKREGGREEGVRRRRRRHSSQEERQRRERKKERKQGILARTHKGRKEEEGSN